MRKTSAFLSVILGFVLLLSSCSTITDAKKVSDQFMGFIKEKNYDQAVSLISEEGIDASPQEDWVEIFESTFELMGEMKDFSSGNIHASTDDGRTETKVRYTVEYEKGTLYVLVLLVKEGKEGTFEILGYNQSEDESNLDF